MTQEPDERMAEQYENRKETIQAIIDTCADRPDMDEWGAKAEVAREVGVEDHRVQYVVNEWSGLIEWRRHANRSPVSGEAVKDAYDDDTMQALAEQGEAVADGMGNVRVNLTFTLDEAFRAMKLLPGDLGFKVFSQTIDDVSTGDLPQDGLAALFENRE